MVFSELVPKREPAVANLRFGLVLEQAFGENCQFFMGLAFVAYPIFSRGKKLFQN
jgi:hypothetical protein